MLILQNNDLTTIILKFSNGQKSLDMLLGNKRNSSEHGTNQSFEEKFKMKKVI